MGNFNSLPKKIENLPVVGKIAIGVGGLLLIKLIIFICTSVADVQSKYMQSARDNGKEVYESHSMAQTLAKIDGQLDYYASTANDRVIEIQNQIGQISGYFQQSETEIGDATCVIVQELAKKGIHQSIYETLLDINPKGSMKETGVKYQEFAALYIVNKAGNR